MIEALIVDTEVSQLEKPEVIELAYCNASLELAGFGFGQDAFVKRYKPSFKISCGAMSVHHIIPDDLRDCEPSMTAKLPEVQYMIGHNVDFDWEVLGKPSCRRICTLAFARHFWPNVEGHTLAACIYRIFPFDEARYITRQAHGAEADIAMCGKLLRHFITEHMPGVARMEDLWQLSEAARVPKVWSFGKYKGQEIATTERGYLNWCLKQLDMDQYIKKACKLALGR